MDPGPSSSSTESSHVSDSCGTCDDCDCDDDQSSSLEPESEQSELPSRAKKARFMGAYKYKSKFSKDWTKTWSFVIPLPHSPFSFRCTVCCAHQGIADVRSHIAGKNHQRLARGLEAQTQLSFTPDLLADKVSQL